jgi:hypothetical protein
MGTMRPWLPLLALLAVASLAAAAESVSVRGKLVQQPGKPPAVETRDGKLIALDGDEPTRGVLNDKRLAGFDLEAKGRFTAPARFQVDPIHTRAMFVFKEGKARLITYWCDTCSIRTYTPGLCWCCQEETTLDLRDPESLDP